MLYVAHLTRTNEVQGASSFFLLIAIISLLEIETASRPGIHVSHDSVYYVGAARELLAGNGYRMEHFDAGMNTAKYPPGYPLAITALGIFGLEPLEGARWVNILFFTGSVLLLFAIARQQLSRWWIATLPPTLFMLSADLVQLHQSVLTEGMFMFFTILGFFALSRHLEQPRAEWLVTGGLSIGLAFLSRFAGIMLPPLLLLVFLLHRRWKDGLIATALSILPMGCFILRNLIIAGTLSEREAQINWIPFPKLLGGVEVMLNAFSFNAHATNLRIVEFLLIVLLPGLGLFLDIKQKKRVTPLTTFLLGFIIIYPLFLLTHITFVQPVTPLDIRLLSPLLPAIYLLIAIGLNYWVSNYVVLTIYAAINILIGLLFFRETQYLIREIHTWGPGGYTGKEWQASPILKAVGELPNDKLVYTNAHDAFYLYYGLTVKSLPLAWTPESLVAIVEELKSANGHLVVSDKVFWRDFKELEKSLINDHQQSPTQHLADGRIYSFDE